MTPSRCNVCSVLQARIKEMEDFVEKADAGRLEMAARVAELSAQLATVRREEQDSFDQVGQPLLPAVQDAGQAGCWVKCM
jgi:hypothetical protein